MDKIICFGKNYTEHMYELGDAPVDKPVIFLKPPSVLKQCANWGDSVNAVLVNDYETHYECEIVIKLAHGGYNMTQDEAIKSIDSYTIGLDMTLRDLQAKLKAAGHPWTIGKVFPDAAIIGPWVHANNLDFLDYNFSFVLDGVTKQQSTGRSMIYSSAELIMQASKHFPLCAGDIIFTGTPAGVGAIKNGSSAKLNIGKYNYDVIWSQK